MSCVVCNSENPNSAVSCSCCGSPLRPETALTPALPVGTRLQGGLYSIGKVLGQGGFGITYLGSDSGLKRAVAIKEFFPQVQGCSRDGATVQPGGMITHLEYRQEKNKFLTEGQRLAQFQHPSIVKVFSLFEENNTAYMVMEFLRGKTLLKIVEEDGRLEERDAVAYIVQIAEALDVIHGLKLLHRDIKPENIIITEEGRAVLVDFGTAREFAAGKTRRMTTTLTPGYAPLEQYGQRARFGVFTDIYALGATLYHLLTGEMPIHATDRATGVELPALQSNQPEGQPQRLRRGDVGVGDAGGETPTVGPRLPYGHEGNSAPLSHSREPTHKGIDQSGNGAPGCPGNGMGRDQPESLRFFSDRLSSDHQRRKTSEPKLRPIRDVQVCNRDP